MPRSNPREGSCGKKRSRGKRRERVKKDEEGGGPFGAAKFASDVAQVCVFAPVYDRRRHFRYVTSEDVAPDGGSGHTDYHSEPRIQIEFNKQNNEKDPGRRREDRNRIDRERGEENEKLRHARGRAVDRSTWGKKPLV